MRQLSLEEKFDREFQRQELHKEIKQRILDLEDTDEHYVEIEKRERFQTFLELFYKQLCGYFGKKVAHILVDPTDILKKADGACAKLFMQVRAEILNFQRTSEEGDAMFAQLLEWTAGQIAYPYRADLQKIEVLEPGLIYGPSSPSERRN